MGKGNELKLEMENIPQAWITACKASIHAYIQDLCESKIELKLKNKSLINKF